MELLFKKIPQTFFTHGKGERTRYEFKYPDAPPFDGDYYLLYSNEYGLIQGRWVKRLLTHDNIIKDDGEWGFICWDRKLFIKPVDVDYYAPAPDGEDYE